MDRLGEALAAGPQLLDLCMEHLAAARQVGQHTGPQRLRLLDHHPTLGAGPFSHLFGVQTHLFESGRHLLLGSLLQCSRRGICLGQALGQQRVRLGLRLLGHLGGLGHQPLGHFDRLGLHACGLSCGVADHLRRGVVRALQHACGLLAHGGGQHRVVDHRIGRTIFGIGQCGHQFVLAIGKCPKAGGDRFEVVAHLGRVESPSDRGEGVPGHIVWCEMGGRSDGHPALLRHGQSLRPPVAESAHPA